MTTPTPTPYPEMVRVIQARDDRAFQRFLSQSFGQRIRGEDENVVVQGFAWRGSVYITSQHRKNLD